MIGILNNTALAAEEIDSIGTGFAKRYYDALMGKSNAPALRQFYNERSKYVFVQPGRPDCEMEGLLLIGRFLKRTRYNTCEVTIRSVVTARTAHPAEFTVLSVCELSRPEGDVPRTFSQSSVVKRVPWTAAEYQIAVTVFKFDDGAVDFSIPIAVGDKPEVSRAIGTGASSKLVNPRVVFDRRASGKPRAIGTPADRELNSSGKRSTTRSTLAGSGVVLDGKVRGPSSPRRTANKLARGTATVPEKSVAGKPAIAMTPQPVANNALKVVSKKTETQTTVNKTIGDKSRKGVNDLQRTVSVRPARGDRITFVSSNRYGCLAAVDEDCSSDIEKNSVHPSSGVSGEAFNYGRSKKSKCIKSTAPESKESKNSRAVVQVPEDQHFALRIPTYNVMSAVSVDTSKDLRKKSERCKNIPSAVASSERVVKTFAKSDELIVRKHAVRLVGTRDLGHREGSMDDKKENKSEKSDNTEMVCRNLQYERPDIVHQVHTPKQRPINLQVPTASDQNAPNESNGRSKKSRRKHERLQTQQRWRVAPQGPNEVVVA